MKVLARIAAVFCLAVVATACDSLEESVQDDAGSVQAPASSTGAQSDAVARGGETLGRGLTLLAENYVERVEMSSLMAAAQRGAWQALTQTGALPLDLEVPVGQALVADTVSGFRARYARVAQRHGSKVDPVWLSHEMLRRATESIGDCHTGFLSPRQVQEQAQRMSGSTRFGGVGVILRRTTDGSGFAVVEIFDQSPALQAGVKRGDLIVSVDDVSIVGAGIEQVVGIVRGPEGTPVKLGVRRSGIEGVIAITVTRAQVSSPIVVARVLDGNVGYVRLYGFPEPMTAELDRALRELERRGVAGLIVDLRDNSGGSLDVVTKVTSRFVREGPLFQRVSQEGQKTVYRADGSYWRAQKPIVVMVNGGTGSGGEILAAAVKEHRAGILLGTTTSGCVSTAQLFPLPDGAALEIATDRVVSGIRSAELNKVGVAPDVTIETTPVDLANDRDPQLASAIALLAEG